MTFLNIFCSGWLQTTLYTRVIELNISQYLARFDQYPLFLIFLNLRKVCNTVDRGHIIRNL